MTRVGKRGADKTMFGFSFASLIFSVAVSIIFGGAFAVATRIVGYARFLVTKLPIVLKHAIADKVGNTKAFVATCRADLERDDNSCGAVEVFLKIVCFTALQIILFYFLLDGVLRLLLIAVSAAAYYVFNIILRDSNGKRRHLFETPLLIIAILIRVVCRPVIHLSNIIVRKMQKMYKKQSFCSTLSLDKRQ